LDAHDDFSPAAVDGEHQHVADAHAFTGLREVFAVRNGRVAHGHNGVANPQSGFLGRAAGDDVQNDDAAVHPQAQLTHVAGVDGVIADADKRPDHHAASDQVFQNGLRLVDRDGEADALGVRSYRRVDADGLTAQVEQ